MDYTQYAVDLFHQHKELAAFLLGAIGSRPVLCADLVFKALMKTPFKALVLRAAPTVISWADAFEAEISKDVKEEAAKDAAAAPAPAPAPAAAPNAPPAA